MIKLSIADDIKELEMILKKYFIQDIILLALGIAALIIYISIKNLSVLSEVVLIIGWVFIWESIYNIFFSRTEIKYKIRKRKQLLKSDIIFV